MVLLFAIATLGGIGLGLRFRVPALAPAIPVGVVLGILSEAPNHNTGRIILVVLAMVALLQVGYMIGSFLQTFWPARAGVLLRRETWLY